MDKLDYKWTTVQQDHNGDWFFSPIGANKDSIVTVEDQRQFLKDLTEAYKENIKASYAGIVHWMAPDASVKEKMDKILEIWGPVPCEELVDGLIAILPKEDRSRLAANLLSDQFLITEEGWVKKVESL